MTKKFKQKLMKVLYRSVAVVGACGFLFAAGVEGTKKGATLSSTTVEAQSGIKKINGNINLNTEKYFDNTIVSTLPESVAKDEEISVIVTMNSASIVDVYKQKNTTLSLTEFVGTAEAKKIAKKAKSEQNAVINDLKKSNVPYSLGERYDTVLNGFEVLVKASDLNALEKAIGSNGTLMISETYAPAVTEPVTNDVVTYETGIFDSSEVKDENGRHFQGDGVVVAVLDTGLDYTHSAFDVSRFKSNQLTFTQKSVSEKVSGTSAATFTKGLTGEDVYMNAKVPFAYDYADKDPDVLPISNSHGTHVAGIIAGHDDTITGVAPNAQLAIMKVFSDGAAGAKDSWLIAALEDCVVLGVDVINMSLGVACGFAREADKEKMNVIYDSIHEAGISMVVAASNSGNATSGSEKNGSLGLTSNPDSGTVGSPSTYSATLSVASVDGVKTPYFKYGKEIIYFKEAMNSAAKTKDFVDEILDFHGNEIGEHLDSYDFEYVTIPGIGRDRDYPMDDEYYKGKIVLVKRGTTTFEDKVRIALEKKGAAGIIIYNNVSGEISMSVGKDYGAVCSISQDEGEMLAEQGTGILHLSRNYLAGPFMSSFSSWGPTSGLEIKPEITAHGGEILSAVPGGSYERLSGTSMACPNQAGATALIRQYVKSGKFGDNLTNKEINALVYQLMMSTTDIVKNKNGIPFAVRKQGAGLVNMQNAIKSNAYIITTDKNGVMEKSKLELGDDKNRTGVYEMSFEIRNIGGNPVSYDLDSVIQTEGVSETLTAHGETTVTQEGYLLDAQTTIIDSARCTVNGKTVTVAAGETGKISLRVVLSDADKAYLDASFENGMYVEGFIKLIAKSGTTVNMSVPLLAFYGDWTEAPIFDEEYYDTHKDELNEGLDVEDKMMPDAFATRIIGKLYSDYISTMGAYYFVQNPAATKIAADKKHISISNQNGTDEGDTKFSLSTLDSINAGFLRNVKEVKISIVEDSTGIEIFNCVDYDRRKSYSVGSSVYPSVVEIDFSALEHNLKNNTQYTVTVEAYIDYGAQEEQKNKRSVFTFPLYVDFQSPILTDVRYYTEYDESTKKTKLFADLSIYDNHYAMSLSFGQIVRSEDPKYLFSMESFGQYMIPVYSDFNSTSSVTLELTDYISQIKKSVGMDSADRNDVKAFENNSFVVSCYDYALNASTYEIRLPDEVLAMYFEKDGKTIDTITLNPNETLDLTTILKVYPALTWEQIVEFSSSDSATAHVINQTVLAKKTGEATITAIGYDSTGKEVRESILVKVRGPEDDGYKVYSVPEVNRFDVYGYKTLKAFYSISSEDREIGTTDSTNGFEETKTLSMYPSESVQLLYNLDAYTDVEITYQSNNKKIAIISDDGVITACAEGSTMVTAKAGDFKTTIRITVKDPFTTSAMYLQSYKGNGGEVIIPDDRGLVEISAFAFSNYEYVEKDLEKGDVINDEDPYYLKQWYIGEDTITKVVIPEGVEIIQEYAFANLSALEEVVLPKTLKNIAVGAFYNCQRLKKINLENVQFINDKAFGFDAEEIEEKIEKDDLLTDEEKEAKIKDLRENRQSLSEIKLSSIVAIGNYAFKNCWLTELQLPASSQSLGEGAFYGNKYMESVAFVAPKMKIGPYAFANCSMLDKVNVNAAVVASYAFYNCQELADITLGVDVAVLGEYAFAGTQISKFKLDQNNEFFSLDGDGAFINKTVNSEKVLVMVAPEYRPEKYDGKEGAVYLADATEIAAGAFTGAKYVNHLIAPNVKTVGDYAFAGCKYLVSVSLPKIEKAGNYAFAGTALTGKLDVASLKTIGDYAFAGTDFTEIVIADDTTIGEYAFSFYQETQDSDIDYNDKLNTVKLGDNVKVGKSAFYAPIGLATYEIVGDEDVFDYYYEEYPYFVKDENGNRVKDENGQDVKYVYLRYNFQAGVRSKLFDVKIGKDCELGEQAFAGNAKLETLSIGDGTTVGDYAFFNTTALTSVDLKGITYFGKYAFGGSRLRDYWLDSDEVLRYALERIYKNGEDTLLSYIYSDFGADITELDLSRATFIGEGAFAGNDKLTNLKLGNELTAIPDYAFFGAKSLNKVQLPEKVSSIGTYAFYATSIVDVNLDKVSKIGDYAFAKANLTEITLASGATVGEGAFLSCEKLEKVNNLENLAVIDAYAFQKTALTSVKLTNVEKLGDYAFGGSKIVEVDFGTEGKLVQLGENPFYDCNIQTFGKKSTESFNQTNVGTTIVETYDVSSKVKVRDGVLYQTVPNGLVLVSYPTGNAAKSFVVPEGVVRISASAFRSTGIESVSLPSTLKAIGDKAFYECESLMVVTFNSYNAPILEEEYDEYYITYEHLPFTGNYYGYDGMGIVPFYMWNIASNFNNFFFGANFSDYIGKVNKTLVMVKPLNGQNYDSFIFSKYFATSINGSNAAMEGTLKVIALIAALPTDITLEDKQVIIAAREAFEAIGSFDQKALVSNLSKLTAAEAMIEYLEYEQKGEEPVVEPEKPAKKTEDRFGSGIVLGCVIGVVVALAVSTVVLVILKKKTVCKKDENDSETVAQEQTEDSEDESGVAEVKSDEELNDSNEPKNGEI